MLSVVQYFYSKVPSSIPLNSLFSYPVAAGRFVADRLYFGCRRYTHNIAHTADTIPGAVSLLNPARKIDSEAYRSTLQRLSLFYSAQSPAINSVEFAPILPAISFVVNSFGHKDISSIHTTSIVPGTSFPSARTIRAVFTDFDGTIGSTDKYHMAGYNDALATIGVSQAMTQEEYDQWSYTDDAGVLSSFAKARGLDLSRDVINVLVRIKQQATLKRLQGAPVLFPHAVEFFRALNLLHIPLILVSMADRPVVEQCLRNSNALSLFSHLITCEDVAQGKPHPEPYQRALKHLNEQLLAAGDKQLVAPSEVMVLEDTFGGVTSGHSFGGTVVAMTHTTPVPRLQAAGADFTCDSLADLGALFFRDILSAAQRLTVRVHAAPRAEVELLADKEPETNQPAPQSCHNSASLVGQEASKDFEGSSESKLIQL